MLTQEVMGVTVPVVPMQRIHVHWTGGTHTANIIDKKAYHLLVEGDGTIIQGIPTIDKNSVSLKSGYAAHTYRANTGAIGVSMCGMIGATEYPYKAGQYPIGADQFDRTCRLIAALADLYGIPCTPTTILFHAEVQANLGIKQRAKWDFTVLPFAPEFDGAAECGAFLRRQVAEYMVAPDDSAPSAVEVDPIPVGARAVVATNGGGLNLRRSPGGEVFDSLLNGERVEVMRRVESGGSAWYHVETMDGETGYASAEWIDIVDGPDREPAPGPTPYDETQDALDCLKAVVARLEGVLRP